QRIFAAAKSPDSKDRTETAKIPNPKSGWPPPDAHPAFFECHAPAPAHQNSQVQTCVSSAPIGTEPETAAAPPQLRQWPTTTIPRIASEFPFSAKQKHVWIEA